MKGRWSQVAVTTAALVAINLVARLIVRLSGTVADQRDFLIGIWSLGAMTVVLGAVSFVWTRRYLMSRVGAYIFFTVVISSVFVTLVGPFVSGSTPFGAGQGFFLLQLGVCAAALVLGALIGVLLAMAFGLDPKSRAWDAYAKSVKLPKNAQRPGKAKTKPKARSGRR